MLRRQSHNGAALPRAIGLPGAGRGASLGIALAATMEDWIRHGDLYFAFAPSYTPQPLSAAIGGTIRMPKATWFAAARDCAAFSIAGIVQTGTAPIVDPSSFDIAAGFRQIAAAAK